MGDLFGEVAGDGADLRGTRENRKAKVKLELGVNF